MYTMMWVRFFSRLRLFYVLGFRLSFHFYGLRKQQPVQYSKNGKKLPLLLPVHRWLHNYLKKLKSIFFDIFFITPQELLQKNRLKKCWFLALYESKHNSTSQNCALFWVFSSCGLQEAHNKHVFVFNPHHIPELNLIATAQSDAARVFFVEFFTKYLIVF